MILPSSEGCQQLSISTEYIVLPTDQGLQEERAPRCNIFSHYTTHMAGESHCLKSETPGRAGGRAGRGEEGKCVKPGDDGEGERQRESLFSKVFGPGYGATFISILYGVPRSPSPSELPGERPRTYAVGPLVNSKITCVSCRFPSASLLLLLLLLLAANHRGILWGSAGNAKPRVGTRNVEALW